MKLSAIITGFAIMTLVIQGCQKQNRSESTAKIWTEEERQLLISGLEETRRIILEEIDPLSTEQWHYQFDSSTWSIALVIEHISLQEVMHYREIYIISKTPPQPKYVEKAQGNDELILKYETDPTKGIANWGVTPLGRWCDKADAVNQFNRATDKLIEFVSETDADLRQQFTFRDIPDESDFRRIRDLHQILLTTITHTKRHIHQIRRIKSYSDFPIYDNSI